MSAADWRNPAAYAACQSLDAPGFAWEYLRRNNEFRSQRSQLEQDAAQGTLDDAAVQAFTVRWGVSFPTIDPDTAGGAVTWAPHALSSVVALTAQPPGLADPAYTLDIHLDRVVHSGPTASFHLLPGGAQLPAALLPFDRLFEQRARAAIRAWRVVTGRSPGPDPAALPRQRRDRLVLGLRALDGRAAKASYRDLASTLLAMPPDMPNCAWKTHDLRDRTIRLVRYGVAMTHGGYRRLLLHPYRGRAG